MCVWYWLKNREEGCLSEVCSEQSPGGGGLVSVIKALGHKTYTQAFFAWRYRAWCLIILFISLKDR